MTKSCYRNWLNWIFSFSWLAQWYFNGIFVHKINLEINLSKREPEWCTWKKIQIRFNKKFLALSFPEGRLNLPARAGKINKKKHHFCVIFMYFSSIFCEKLKFLNFAKIWNFWHFEVKMPGAVVLTFSWMNFRFYLTKMTAETQKTNFWEDLKYKQIFLC